MSALLLPNEILSMSAQAARLLVESGNGQKTGWLPPGTG